MPVSNKKIIRLAKIQENTQSEGEKEASEPDSYMAEILILLDCDFKIGRINMINTLLENIDHVQEQMGIEMKTLRIKRKC